MPVVEIHQDSASDSVSTIGFNHKKIHEGLHFSTCYYEKIGAASAINILITAPSTTNYNFIAEIDTDGPGIWTFSKNPNATASGATTITAFNNNENSSNISTLTHTVGGTYTSSGTILVTHVIGNSSGLGANSIIMGGENMIEIELAPSSVHLLRFVADASSCRTSILTHFHKEE